MVRSCAFDRRSDLATLAANGGSSIVTYRTDALFRGAANGSEWRIVQAVSLDSRPWQMRLAWTAGEGQGFETEITCARAVRTCLFARDLTIHAANLTNATNRVVVTIPDGFMPTSNQLEVRGSQAVGDQEVTIPQFATHVRLDLETDSAYTTSYLRLRDPSLTTRALVYANAQPDAGIPIGAAYDLYVNATASWRVTFTLQL